MWRHHAIFLLNNFFQLSICAVDAKIQPDKVVGCCPDGDFFSEFWVLHFQRAACSTFQTCILNSHQGHTMCATMVDIRSPTAETRQGKKTELEMWANAQRDGRPAEYRWRPLLNAAVWLTATTSVPCSNAAKTRNLLKLAGVPQTNETISAVSVPKFTILWDM